jgi:hypothetical protein
MHMKKSWSSPLLTTYGSIEHLTEVSYGDLHQISQSFLPEQAMGLLATLGINPPS